MFGIDINVSGVIEAARKVIDSVSKMTDEKMIKLCRNGDLKRIKRALEHGAT